MNIWLDDQRKPPDGWVHLHNLEEVEQLIKLASGFKDFCIERMSFDFHLSHPKRGIDVMKYLAEQCNQDNTRRFWPKTVLYHSNDPKGVKIMRTFAISFQKVILPE
ncbi:MAG: hypothetical protein NTV24_04910, partial [Candidatus Woesebacteria bacterium]|nr:hypothetical protein [Candidatus Woesebacteria bacterium]